MTEFKVGDKVLVASGNLPRDKEWGEITQLCEYFDGKGYLITQAEVTYKDNYKVWVHDIYAANLVPRMMKQEYGKLEFVFLDRAFDDGWAEPYKVTLFVTGDVLSEQLVEIGMKLSSTVGLHCSGEGIESIIQKHMEENPGVIVNYTIETMDCVPFGGKPANFKHWYER